MKFVGMDQITYKNVKENNPMHANQILLSLNRWPIVGQSKIPMFFHTQFQMVSNHYEIKIHFQTFDNLMY